MKMLKLIVYKEWSRERSVTPKVKREDDLPLFFTRIKLSQQYF